MIKKYFIPVKPSGFFDSQDIHAKHSPHDIQFKQ